MRAEHTKFVIDSRMVFRCFIKRFCYRNESEDNDKLTIDKKSLCLSGHANILLIWVTEVINKHSMSSTRCWYLGESINACHYLYLRIRWDYGKIIIDKIHCGRKISLTTLNEQQKIFFSKKQTCYVELNNLVRWHKLSC